VAAAPAFVAGDIDTGFIERHAAALIPAKEPGEAVARAAARALVEGSAAADPWARLTGFRAGGPRQLEVAVAIGDEVHLASAEPAPPSEVAEYSTIELRGERVLFWRGEAWRFGLPTSDRIAGSGAVSDGALRSPMPGRIVNVAVRHGDTVSKGQTLLALEAMKMEHSMLAPFDGVVAELTVAEGDQVAENVTLVRIIRPP
jgi:3-methylcrotonyl-CoA carboxylase alpha subunit